MANDDGLKNAVLVRFDDTAAWFTDETSIDQYGRLEGYLTLGRVDDIAVVEQAATAWLAARSQPRVAVTAEVEPTLDGDVPGDDVELGQTVVLDPLVDDPIEAECVGLTFDWSTDNEDQLRKVLELDTLRNQQAADADRALRQVVQEAGGVAGVRPSGVGTTIPSGKIREVTGPWWSWNAATDLDLNTSGWQPWRAETGMRLYRWQVECEAGTGTSKFRLYIAGSTNVLTDLILGPTDTLGWGYLFGYFVAYQNELIVPACYQNGGHTNGSVRVLGAEIL